MRILLITLFYKPLNNIAVTRLTAFQKHLTELGHEVDVLTRHYSEKDISSSNQNKGMLLGNDFKGDYYRKENVIYTKYSTKNSKLSISKKLPKGIKGVYNVGQFDVFHYSFVEYGLKAYEQEFLERPHDIILASSPVPAALLLAKKISLIYNIKWVADFRDSYIDGSENKLLFLLKKRVLNKVLSNCSGCVFVSEGMKTQNLKVFNSSQKKLPLVDVFNGFSKSDDLVNQEVIFNLEEIKKSNKKLLVYTGTIYPQRQLNFFLDSIDEITKKSVVVVLVGIQNEYKELIQKHYAKLSVIFVDKVNYATSIKIQELADFLLLTIWRGYYTGFSGKVFEYLYSGKPILVDYDPAQDLKDYLKDFENILYCDGDQNKFIEFIEDSVTISLNLSIIRPKLERRYQIEKLNRFLIDKILDK